MLGTAAKSAALPWFTLPPYSNGVSEAASAPSAAAMVGRNRAAHDLVCDLRCRSATGTDGPYRLIGDGKGTGGGLGVHVDQRGDHLATDDLGSPTRLPLVQRLANAYDGTQSVLQGSGDLAADGFVRLAEELTALRVADDHVVAQSDQHRRSHLAGEGSTLVGVHVLSSHGHAAPGHRIPNRRQRNEGRRDDEPDPGQF